jgi:preprotein translocase SecE subunit
VAKTRAQRKAERRRREQQRQRQRGQRAAAPRDGERAIAEQESRAQQETQMGVSGEVREAEAAIETGQVPDDLRAPEPAAAPEAAPPPEAAAPAASETSIREAPPAPEAPAPSRADVGRPEPEAPAVPEPKESRRARREREKEERRRARAREQRGQAERAERRRGPVLGFFASCWAELKRVQWPNRDTLVQASAVTLIFVAIMAAYLGGLDALFNFLVKQIL